jgi:hypothetical protein
MPLRFTRKDNWEFGGRPDPSEIESGEPRSRKRRLATTLVFTSLFFAGASFAAVAGDQLTPLLSSDGPMGTVASDETTSTDASADPSSSAADTTAVAPATDPSAETAPAPDTSAPSDATAPADTGTAPADPAAAPTDMTASTADGTTDPNAEDAAPAAADNGYGTSSATTAAAASGRHRTKAAGKHARDWKRVTLRSILVPKQKPAPAPEIEGPPSAATVWLNSQLPDPTPPALRLSRRFAKALKATSRNAGLDWATMLGVLRARGATGHNPADRVTLRKLAARLASTGPTKGDWARIVSYSGDTAFADKAAALARYDRAVGLAALVKGLEAAKKSIATRLLSDPQVSIYEGGRNDIVQDKVDVRVLAVIAYLRETFGQVTVSCLISGHRLYARPGVISAHIPGHAADISGLENTPIQGHQQPGGMTERAVRALLFLPREDMPKQIISLLGLGGPSFPLADHYNHIHIGF